MQPNISALPLVLCGPMVRRVTSTAATFWIATKRSCHVRVSVFDSAGELVATGQRETCAIGKHLHVAAVTASGTMRWGQTYCYNLHLDEQDLLAPGIVARDRRAAVAVLSYHHICADAPELPSFVMPDAELNKTRLLHASCRLLQGEGKDALVGVDMMHADAIATNDTPRPQQLFLTGDQIYADLLPAELGQHLTDTGLALLGWSEPNHSEHCQSLSQFYANYLMAWSAVLWPADVTGSLAETKHALAAVRRGLANTSTLMIFDDHEVTDDWYLTLEWTERALAQPDQRRMIMNALCAYAVFQAWGNTPEQFDHNGPGAQLLEQLGSWRGHADDTAEANISELVGISRVSDLRAHTPPQLNPGPRAIAWHYRVEGPNYEIVVLDTRTWRSFPGPEPDAPPLMMSDAGYDAQIRSMGSLHKPLTIVISPAVVVNLPQTWYGKLALGLHHQYKAYKQGRSRRYAKVYGADRGDWWSQRPDSVGNLLAALLSNVAESRTRVVLLSGDMHVGAAARLQYWGSRDGRPTTLVAAQLLSSPLKHESAGTRLAQFTGYRLFGKPPSLSVRHRQHAYRVDFVRADDGTEIVGHNHLAELAFEWSERHKHVTQITWWSAKNRPQLAPRSRFRISLDYVDPAYPAVYPA